MDLVMQGPRVALRSLLRRPGFTALAVLTIGLGVGASTSMFSVLHGVVIRPMPYPRADRVVRLFPVVRDSKHATWTGADFVDYQAGTASYQAIAGFRLIDHSVREGDFPVLVYAASVTSQFFQVLGVPPLLGRVFSPETDRPGGERVVVLSHGFWQSRFAADRALVGRRIELDGEAFTVVGVMPPGFSYPTGMSFWVCSRYRVPEFPESPSDPAESRGERYFEVVARLRDGVSVADARHEGAALAARLAAAFPETNRGQGFELVDLHEYEVGPVRATLIALFGAAGLVLLVACANVANLLLARAASRSHEIAVRVALGAGRAKVARQLLTESALLGLLGGAVGALLAIAGTELLLTRMSAELPRAADVTFGLPVLGFAFAISLFSGVLFGLAPTLWLARTDPATSLQRAGTRSVAGSAMGRARVILVATEMAVCLTLLVGAALLVRTVMSLAAMEPGFSERNAVTARIWIPGSRSIDDDSLRAFHRALLDRVRNLPGVVSAGAVLSLPVDGAIRAMSGYSIEGRGFDVGNEPVEGLQAATPGYFESIGIPVIRGRSFNDGDGPNDPPVVVVSESFAQRYFPGEDPIGKRIGSGTPQDADFQWATIVGVVGSTRHEGLDGEERAEVFQPLAQRPWPWITLVLRTSVAPAMLIEPLRHAVTEVSPSQPVEAIHTMEEVLARSLSTRREQTHALSVFALLALALAAVGMYGVMSFAVAQRSREIGIRMAVGADRRAIVHLILGEGGKVLIAGLAAGALGAFVLGRLMSSFLFHVKPADPVAFAVAAAILTAAGLLAAWLPASRAARTDPVRSLRVE